MDFLPRCVRTGCVSVLSVSVYCCVSSVCVRLLLLQGGRPRRCAVAGTRGVASAEAVGFFACGRLSSSVHG